MKVAAYCRVSTDKSDQLNSLEMQKRFFVEFAEKGGHALTHVYADEGISGTKIRNRREFQRLLDDAQQGLFEMVVVKDISRFARNTVDFLQSIRSLKALGIETMFLTANMTVLGNSEFVLTIFGALAQEESANTSKRIKFGKRINAEKGRVPNLVFGYNKIPGDYFHLQINAREAEVVRRIFDWYTAGQYGAGKIAERLNADGSRTKRGCRWTQSAVCRVLTNPLYTGVVANGKQEIADFLTGARTDCAREQWLVCERPELRIIPPQQFERAADILAQRSGKFAAGGGRTPYAFTALIRCKECGGTFRRVVRTYRKTYVRWVCGRRNGQGAASCANAVSIDEAQLCEVLDKFLSGLLLDSGVGLEDAQQELFRACLAGEEAHQAPGGRQNERTKLHGRRQKYLDLYADDLITRAELDEQMAAIRRQLENLRGDERQSGPGQREALRESIRRAVPDLHAFVDVGGMVCGELRQVLHHIEVDRHGNAEIVLCRPEPRRDKTVPSRRICT